MTQTNLRATTRRCLSREAPKAGQGEGGHPTTEQQPGTGGLFGFFSKPGFIPLKVIIGGVVVYAGYQAFIVEPSKPNHNPGIESDDPEKDVATARKFRTQARFQGPFGSKNRQALGIIPSDPQLDEQQMTYSGNTPHHEREHVKPTHERDGK